MINNERIQQGFSRGGSARGYNNRPRNVRQYQPYQQTPNVRLMNYSSTSAFGEQSNQVYRDLTSNNNIKRQQQQFSQRNSFSYNTQQEQQLVVTSSKLEDNCKEANSVSSISSSSSDNSPGSNIIIESSTNEDDSDADSVISCGIFHGGSIVVETNDLDTLHSNTNTVSQPSSSNKFEECSRQSSDNLQLLNTGTPQNIQIAQLKIEKQMVERDLSRLSEQYGDLQQSYNDLYRQKSSDQLIPFECILQQAKTVSQCDDLERKFQTALEHIRLIKKSLIRKELEAANERLMCVICQEKEKSIAFLPCSHVCLCEECDELQDQKITNCPLCRAFIYQKLRVIN